MLIQLLIGCVILVVATPVAVYVWFRRTYCFSCRKLTAYCVTSNPEYEWKDKNRTGSEDTAYEIRQLVKLCTVCSERRTLKVSRTAVLGEKAEMFRVELEASNRQPFIEGG